MKKSIVACMLLMSGNCMAMEEQPKKIEKDPFALRDDAEYPYDFSIDINGAQDMRRTIEIEALMKNHILHQDENQNDPELLKEIKEGLQELSTEQYNRLVSRIVTRGRPTKDTGKRATIRNQQNIALALQAMVREMKSSSVVQENSYKQQVESANFYKKTTIWGTVSSFVVLIATNLINYYATKSADENC